MAAVNNINLHQLASAAVAATDNPFQGLSSGPGMHIAGGNDAPNLSPRQYVGVRNDLITNGGFSVRPFPPATGGSPVDAYSTGMPKYRDESIQNGEVAEHDMTGTRIRNFAVSRRDMGAYSDPHTILGGWIDEGKAYVDVSKLTPRTIPGLRAAIALGNSGNEYGVGAIDDEGEYAHTVNLTKLRGEHGPEEEQKEARRAWASTFVTDRDRGTLFS